VATPTLSQHWLTLRTAALLGWEMESNWTDPLLFAFYSVVKPISSTLILVFIYIVITQGETHGDLFAYIYVGNALFFYVAQVLFGIGHVIQQEREWFQTIRYLYISPSSFHTYLLGRAATQVGMATIAFGVTLAFGVVVLGIPLGLNPQDLPLLVASMVLGLLAVASVAIALAGLTFLTARHAQGIAEGIPGIFYLFCGTVFPITLLPGWGQALSYALPPTYWFSLARRLLLPSAPHLDPLGVHPVGYVLTILAASTALATALSYASFKLLEGMARRRGRIDAVSGY
jgi:ABC-2 type transport system permease protein